MRISKKLVDQGDRDTAWLNRKEKAFNKKKSSNLNRKLREKLDAGQMVSSIIRDVTRQAEDRTLKNKHVRAEYLRVAKLRKQSNPRLFDKELERGLNHINHEISIENEGGIIEKDGVKTFKGSGCNAFALFELDRKLDLTVSKSELNANFIKQDRHTMCKIGGQYHE
jgi:predicted RNase H-like nuclease (RuvC/YqgF family)